jgi:hypothetical protein
MNMKIRIVVPMACLAIAVTCGCNKKEENVPSTQKTESATTNPQQTQPAATNSQQTQPTTVSAALPPALAGKTQVLGGIVALDSINKQTVVTKVDTPVVIGENRIDIQGWAVNDSNKSAPEVVLIELSNVKNNEKYYAAAKRVNRPDIAKAFKESAYNNAGLWLNTDIKVMPPGEYLVNIIQIDNGNAILTSKGYKINKTN